MKVPIALAAAFALLVGCSSSGSGDGGDGTGSSGGGALSGSIAVDAASSLTEAFDTLKSQFEAAHPGTTIKITYGASSDLSTQISQGAPVDVFASASTTNMDDLGDQAVHPTNFVVNTLEIAVPPGNPAGIQSVEDLAKSDVKVAVCDPAVPCGVVAAQVFDNAGITVHPKASLADVKSTLAAVESGEVDAGIVYVTDVRAAGNQVEGVEIPSDVNATTTYPIAVLKDAPNPVLAQAWVDYVLSAAGRKVLTADGFGRP
ncbi:MAG TPA: molybdate ABC transporter substrate-binding protein [Jatrophihabitans sp.]|nr:molybdate ABC transporter substrate-binding protein [Jatrophihabitans sp.]